MGKPKTKRNKPATFSERRKLLKNHVNKLKAAGECSVCGEPDQACLDFHHVSSKVDNISDLVRRAVPMSVLQRELHKCIIVCSNCHRKIHFYGHFTRNNPESKMKIADENKE